MKQYLRDHLICHYLVGGYLLMLRQNENVETNLFRSFLSDCYNEIRKNRLRKTPKIRQVFLKYP